MKESLKITEDDKFLIIQIDPLTNPIVGLGFAFKGILLFLLSVFFGIIILSALPDMGWIAFVFILYVILLFLLAKNYLNSVISKERIEVSKNKLALINKHLTYKEIKIFTLDEITDISYAGKTAFTPHPLEGTTSDYYGFGVAEKEAQALIKDGTIHLFASGSTFRFGKDLPSWDAELIIQKIKDFTGKQFCRENKIQELMEGLNSEE